MALVQLKYGGDARLKRLAQSIIVEQGQEITHMRNLLDRKQILPTNHVEVISSDASQMLPQGLCAQAAQALVGRSGGLVGVHANRCSAACKSAVSTFHELLEYWP